MIADIFKMKQILRQSGVSETTIENMKKVIDELKMKLNNSGSKGTIDFITVKPSSFCERKIKASRICIRKKYLSTLKLRSFKIARSMLRNPKLKHSSAPPTITELCEEGESAADAKIESFVQILALILIFFIIAVLIMWFCYRI